MWRLLVDVPRDLERTVTDDSSIDHRVEVERVKVLLDRELVEPCFDGGRELFGDAVRRRRRDGEANGLAVDVRDGLSHERTSVVDGESCFARATSAIPLVAAVEVEHFAVAIHPIDVLTVQPVS